ncbi:MAG: organomercurial lyase [Gemmatimonadaceae bacterium]
MLDLDTAVKQTIYGVIAETTKAPTSADVARALNRTWGEVEAAFQRLCRKRLLVLEPESRSVILMAPPFSGTETPFLVRVGEKSYYANCVWDALGVAAALHRDADVIASDAQTGEPMSLRVRDGAPVPETCVIHFAVPAAKWWDDIIHT